MAVGGKEQNLEWKREQEAIRRAGDRLSELGINPFIAESLIRWENSRLILTDDGFIFELYEDSEEHNLKTVVDFNVRGKEFIVKTLNPLTKVWSKVAQFNNFDINVDIRRERSVLDLVFQVNLVGREGEKLEVWIDKRGRAEVEGIKLLWPLENCS